MRKAIFAAFILGMATGVGVGAGVVVGAQEALKRGVFDTTVSPGKTGGTLEIVDQDAGISLIQDSRPPNTTNETFIAGFGHTSVGVLAKQFSISSKWVSPNRNNGFSVLRFNSAFFDTGSGEQRDDLAIRIFGGHGVAVFGRSDRAEDAPGANVFHINGTLRYPTLAAPEKPFSQVRYMRLLDEKGEPYWVPAYR